MNQTDVQKILDRTDDGLKVFTHYMDKASKSAAFRNPYREDSCPSCRLYYHKASQGGGKWYLHDYGDSSWRGDCFWFVATICHLNLRNDFREILQIIDKDLNLFLLDGTKENELNYAKMEQRQQPPVTTHSKIIGFEPEFQPFTDSELAYWGRYGITEAVLTQYKVRSIKRCKYTREDGSTYTERSSAQNPIFAYTFTNPASPSGNGMMESGLVGMKIYRPKSKSNRFMYVGTMPKPYIFGHKDWLNDRATGIDIDCLYITGGEKDVLSLLSHGFKAICFNSETATIPDKMMQTLSIACQHVVFLYDCDATGKKESAAREAEFLHRYANVCRVVLPLAGTKEEKDVSDYFSSGHSARELAALTDAVMTENHTP